MPRPSSINWFERLAVLSFVFASVKIALWWPVTYELIAGIEDGRGPDTDGVAHAGRIIGLGLNVLLLVMIARRRSRVAAVAFVALSALWAGTIVVSLSVGAVYLSSNVLGLLTVTTQTAAAGLLLMKASRCWLKGEVGLGAVFE